MQLSDRIKGAIEAFVLRITSKYDYSGFCAYTVVAQNADDTLELKPIDPDKHPALSKVEMRFETPATRCRVKVGAECTVVFANMDPSRYFVFGGFKHGDFEELHFGNNTVPIARQGDLVESGGAGTFVQFCSPSSPGVPLSLVLSGQGSATVSLPGPFLVSFSAEPPTMAIADPMVGFILTASEVSNTQ